MTTARNFCGGCHCGAVRFEVTVSGEPELWLCNCSICSMTGHLHLIVGAPDFRLLSGREVLSNYTFNTGVAQHRFCSRCGIKSFYVPRSHPDGFSVDARCLDGNPFAAVTPREFEGQDWERHAGVFSEP